MCISTRSLGRSGGMLPQESFAFWTPWDCFWWTLRHCLYMYFSIKVDHMPWSYKFVKSRKFLLSDNPLVYYIDSHSEEIVNVWNRKGIVGQHFRYTIVLVTFQMLLALSHYHYYIKAISWLYAYDNTSFTREPRGGESLSRGASTPLPPKMKPCWMHSRAIKCKQAAVLHFWSYRVKVVSVVCTHA